MKPYHVIYLRTIHLGGVSGRTLARICTYVVAAGNYTCPAEAVVPLTVVGAAGEGELL